MVESSLQTWETHAPSCQGKVCLSLNSSLVLVLFFLFFYFLLELTLVYSLNFLPLLFSFFECSGGVLPLSIDQKPESPRELCRIVSSGGFVTSDGRLGGTIGVARAMGDMDLKPWWKEEEEEDLVSDEEEQSGLVSMPDVSEILLRGKRSLLILDDYYFYFLTI